MTDTDLQSRDRIVGDTGRNFFVEAGAGSGKTTVLVSRMVAMVENGIDVSRICAITFTKAAAGEFYDRFRKKLADRAAAVSGGSETHRHGDLPAATDVSRSRCAHALQNIDLCFMGTIDSFCNMVLGEHPAKAHIPSNASVRSDAEIGVLYKREYSAIMRGEYGEDLKRRCFRFRSVNRGPDALFDQSIGTLMRARNDEIICEPPSGQTVDVQFAEEKSQLSQILHAVRSHPEVLRSSNGKMRAANEIIENKSDLLLGNWEQSIPGVMEALKDLSGLTIGCRPEQIGITDGSLFQDLFSRGKLCGASLNPENPAYPLKRLREFQYAVTLDFLCACSGPIAKKLRGTGDLTFDDYLMYLRDVLREDAEHDGRLIRHIYERHSHFLIDEFQDTNPIQAEIFFYLTAREPRSSWKDCIPRPGSLFIVGDPKQSIYRFRDADVASFLQVKEMFRGEVGEVLYLQRNFRSGRQLCGWFNTVFSEMLPEKTDCQSRFDPIPIDDAPETDEGSFGGVYSYECCRKNDDDPQSEDSVRTAEVIRRLVGNPAYTLKEKDGRAPRMIGYRDFMLITPTKAALPKYMQVFVEKGIPFRVEGNVPFEGCPALAAVSAVLSAVAYPNDLLYLYGALTSEVFRVKPSRIYSLKNAGYGIRIYRDESSGTDAEVDAVLNTLKDLVFRSKEMSSSVLFSVILEEQHVLEKVGTLNLEYLYYALELIRTAEISGEIASLQDGADYLAELLSGSSDIERSISLKLDSNRVHIANLHKVKGLEAPIVILAGQTQRIRDPANRIEQGSPRPKCWIFSLSDSLKTENYPAEMQKEADCLCAERMRLLYVAATRAKSALIIGHCMNKSGSEAANNMWTPFLAHCDADFFEAVAEGGGMRQAAPKTEDAAELVRRAGSGNVISGSSSEKATFEICRPSMIQIKSRTSSDDEYEDRPDEEARTRRSGQDAAVIGTMVHRVMEVLVSSGNTADPARLVRETVLEYGDGREEYGPLLMRIAEKMRAGGFEQKNSLPADLLGEFMSAEEVHCEVPFGYRDDSGGTVRIWNGVMDVVYRKDGKWHIIDYKTNADPDDLDEKYRAQTEAYIRAFRQMTGCDADAQIYHIEVQQ